MNIDFSLVLVVLSAITGFVWLVDLALLAKPRWQKVETFLAERKISTADFKAYIESLGEDGLQNTANKDLSKNKADNQKIDPVRQKLLTQAVEIYRDPFPVEYAKSFFPILFAVLMLRSFLFEPFQIPTGSMIPTLNVGDFIVVNKFAYGLRLPVTGTRFLEIGEPKRGDVMVFIPPHDPNYFIKRVIGLPGDKVRYTDNTVYINDEALPQDGGVVLDELGVKLSQESVGGITHSIYTAATQRFNRNYDWLQPEGMVIPEGQYFMMGDNRDNSSDSRYWGPASEANIVGRAVAVWMHKEPGWHFPSFGQNRFIKNPD